MTEFYFNGMDLTPYLRAVETEAIDLSFVVRVYVSIEIVLPPSYLRFNFYATQEGFNIIYLRYEDLFLFQDFDHTGQHEGVSFSEIYFNRIGYSVKLTVYQGAK